MQSSTDNCTALQSTDNLTFAHFAGNGLFLLHPWYRPERIMQAYLLQTKLLYYENIYYFCSRLPEGE